MLPTGYTQLEYIEHDGASYITTNKAWDFTKDHEIKAGYSKVLSNLSTRSFVWGTYGSGSFTSNIETSSDSNYTWRIYLNGGNSNQVFTLFGAGKQEIDFVYTHSTGNISFSVNGLELKNYNYTTHGTATNIRLFEDYRNSQFSAVDRIYYWKYYEEGELVCDFVPAKRNSDNALGFYDKVGGTFYPKEGTGTFFAGPVKAEQYPIWVKENGVWKKGAPLLKINNIWRTPYLFADVVWKDPITLTYSNSNASGDLQYVEAENYPFFKLVGRIRRKTAGSSTGNSYTYFYATNDDLPSIDAIYGVRNRYQLAYTNDLTITTDTVLNTHNEGYEGKLRLRLNNVNSNYWQYYGDDYIWWIDKNRCEEGSLFSGLNFIRNDLSI